MSDSKKFLPLELTAIGQSTMTGLLNKAIKPTLKIALSQSAEVFTGNEANLLTQFIFLSDSIVSLQDDNKITKMHIQASLLTESAFDIQQIGLFIDSKEENTIAPTLLAYYRSGNLIAKKSADIELFLDIIVCLQTYNAKDFTIDSSDYKPFIIPPATYERYGSVRLANPENIKEKIQASKLVLSTAILADRKKIEKGESGFIVTTNDLDIFLSNSKFLKAECVDVQEIDLGEVSDILFSVTCFDNSFINNLITIKSGEVHELFLLQYDSKEKKINQR